jgi:hypothetical protein
MADVATTIDQIIDNAIQVGKETSSDAQQYAERAAGLQAFLREATPTSVSYSPVSPKPQLPAGFDNTAEIQAAFDYSFGKFEDRFQNDIQFVLDTFFPDLTSNLIPAEDAWILGQLNGTGGTGLSPTVEQALYSRGKERLTEEAYRTEAEAMTLFASRGFSLPQGVLFAKVQEAQQFAFDKSGDLARDVLVENTKISVETVKFAAQQATQLRLGMFDALARFLDASVKTPLASVEYSKAFIDARKGVADAIVSYYNVQTKESELGLTAGIKNMENKQAQYQAWGSINASLIGSQASAMVGAANAVGQLAQAAMSSQNTVTSLGRTVSESA